MAITLGRFGDETLYVDTFPSSNGRASIKQASLAEAGTVTSIVVGFTAGTTAGTNMRGLIYADLLGAPGALVAVGASTPVPAGGGFVSSPTVNTLLPAGLYWLGAVCDNSTALHAHNTAGTGTGPNSVMANGTVAFAAPPGAWPGSDANYNYNVSAYANLFRGEPDPVPVNGSIGVTLGAATLSATAAASQPGPLAGIVGDDTAGASSFPGSSGRAVLSRFLMPADGELTHLYLRFAESSGAGANARLLAYADAAGSPSTVLAASASIPVPGGGGTLDAAVSVPGLVEGQAIWLGGVLDNFPALWRTDSNVGGLSRMEGFNYASPGAWTQSGTGADQVNAWGDFEAAAEPGGSAALGITLGSATMAASATVGQAGVSASLAATLGGVTLSSAATAGQASPAGNTAGMSATLGAAVLSASGSCPQPEALMGAHTYNYALFRAQFPAFASTLLYPEIVLATYFDIATCYVDANDTCRLSGDCLQYALNLLTAHLVALNAAAPATGGTPGIVSSATIDKVSVAFQIPTTTSPFLLWLNKTGFGQQLAALLRVKAVGGFYVGGAPERSSIRRVGGRF